MELGQGLNNKGYVTPLDDTIFALELQLLNLMHYRDKKTRLIASFPKMSMRLEHFIVGIGQSIPHLSARARNKLRGQIIGGIKQMAFVHCSMNSELPASYPI